MWICTAICRWRRATRSYKPFSVPTTSLYWVFKLPDVGNDGVPPPPALRGTGREVLSDHVTDAGGVVRRALLLAADERTNRNWPAMGVALAERYTGQRLRIVDNDLALGRGRIPLLDQPYGPYAKGGCRWLPDAVGLSRRLSTFPPDKLLRDHRPAGPGGNSARTHCADRHRCALHQGSVSLRRSVPAGAGRGRSSGLRCTRTPPTN